jgi:hypothetical protein
MLGVPVGVAILGFADPDYMRAGIGALLILYSIYGLARPAMQPIRSGGAPADAGVGVLNGILGGATGLAGIIVTIWCGLRGWPKDVQRTVFQPTGVAIFAMSAVALGFNGAVNADTIRLFLIGLPILLAGMELTDESHWGEIFGRNGTLASTSMGHKSAGKWRIRKDQLCLETGEAPGGGCYEVWISGTNVELRNQDSSLPLEGVLQKPTDAR